MRTNDAHEVHGSKPSEERSRGPLENCPNQRVQMTPATMARIGGAARKLMMFRKHASAGLGIAPGHITREAHLHNALKASLVSREIPLKQFSAVMHTGRTS